MAEAINAVNNAVVPLTGKSVESQTPDAGFTPPGKVQPVALRAVDKKASPHAQLAVAVTQAPQASNLAIASAAHSPENNPLLTAHGLPNFAQFQPEHVVPGMRQVIKVTMARFSEFEKSPGTTWETLVEPLGNILAPISKSWSLVTHLKSVSRSDALDAVYETAQAEVIEADNIIGQSRAVYDHFVALRDGKGWSALNRPQQRIVERTIREAELSGVQLGESDKTTLNAVNQELSATSTRFSENVAKSSAAFKLVLTTEGEVAGLPTRVLAQAAAAARAAGQESATVDKGPWQFGLSVPSFLGVMINGTNRDVRETMYRAYVTRASRGETDNEPLIRKILQLRQKKAELLGFNTFAELSLSEKMAGNVAAVEVLVDKVARAALPVARKELASMQAFAKAAGAAEGDGLKPWDLYYWSGKQSEALFGYSQEEVRSYLPMSKVLSGMFDLAKTMFGVSVVEATGTVPTWNEHVKYYEIFDSEGAKIAAFYLDPFARPGEKRSGAWMNPIISRSKALAAPGEDIRLPVAIIVTNHTPPVDGQEATVSFDEAGTFFHEFGHALQVTLSRVDYAGASSIGSIEWDAVEQPSQFMENWLYHEPTLMGVTAHQESGAKMPKELFDKLVAARQYRAASSMIRQLNFTQTDMDLHHRYDPTDKNVTPSDLHRTVSERLSVMPRIPEDKFLNAFSHIFNGGYAAGYYSYLWAAVLAADGFGAFEEAGLDNTEALQKIGARYRETILGKGGGEHPMKVFEEFRGRKPTPEALLKQLGLAAP